VRCGQKLGSKEHGLGFPTHGTAQSQSPLYLRRAIVFAPSHRFSWGNWKWPEGVAWFCVTPRRPRFCAATIVFVGETANRTPSRRLCNVGSQPDPWHRKASPSGRYGPCLVGRMSGASASRTSAARLSPGAMPER
jgi:hypothetical protein